MFPVLRRQGFETNRNLGQSGSNLSLVQIDENTDQQPAVRLPPRTQQEYMSAVQEALMLTDEQKRGIISKLVDENDETPEDLQCLICKHTAHIPMVCQTNCTAIICQHCYL